MIVKYVDFGGDSQECTGVQFQELYLAGKVPPEQTVLANGEPMEVVKLLEIIEEAEDNALIKAAQKAKLEEEQFQKTAPWWLKRRIRWIINLGACALLPLCLPIDGGIPWKFLYIIVPYLIYQFAGGRRYNPWCDIVCREEYDLTIKQIEKKRKRRRRNADNQNGGKNHG